MLVVIAILGVLSALVITGTRTALARAAAVDCLSDLRQMGLALPPGWRFLLAPDYEDVWYDPSLLLI